jgi:hypothetical protein
MITFQGGTKWTKKNTPSNHLGQVIQLHMLLVTLLRE